MGLIPITSDELKVGLYIKLEHGWSEHPFLRNSFKIRSETDIGIIRNQGLTKIFYDPALSDPQALEDLASSLHSQPENRVAPEEDAALSREKLDEATHALRVKKEELIQKLFTHQDTLNQTEKAYQNALHENRRALKMINMGQSTGLDLSKEIVGSMIDILQCSAPTLTLVKTSTPEGIMEEVSVQSMNVCSLALLLGKTMGLNQEESQTLGQGAMFHNIGLHRVPPARWVERKDALSVKERQFYPQYGRQMMQDLPGISPDCLDIISQHQENIDGSGYPEGLKGTQIAFLPRVIRVVTAYTLALNNGQETDRPTPTDALAYLYTKMKEKCDPDIIDAFIATVTVYPPGSIVRLNDGHVGVVVKTNKSERLRPLVVLYETAQALSDLVIVDLAQEPELSIKESLKPKALDPKILAQIQQSLGGVQGYFVSA